MCLHIVTIKSSLHDNWYKNIYRSKTSYTDLYYDPSELPEEVHWICNEYFELILVNITKDGGRGNTGEQNKLPVITQMLFVYSEWLLFQAASLPDVM